jgi:hypothetical protein
MTSRAVILLILSGLTGYATASISRPIAAKALVKETTCSVPQAYGTLKSIWNDNNYISFEDSKGTIRLLDFDCRVFRTINRQ